MANWTTAEIPAQTGKFAIVTGGNSGIGWHTALELARAGACVVLTARTEAKGNDAVTRILRQVPNASVRFECLDLASLPSIRSFAATLRQSPKLDLLVNNAGVMSVPRREETEDGFERQFGTNFLGPFALTILLFPLLERSGAGRVTTVGSGAANMGLKKIDFSDLQGKRSYKPWTAYCQSKLADLMLMLELGRRSSAHSVRLTSNAAHPGWARTNLSLTGPGKERSLVQRLVEAPFSQDAAHGALPTLRAATEAASGSGDYYAPGGMFQLKGAPVPVALPKPALDTEAASKLWDIAEQLTAVSWEHDAGASLPHISNTQVSK